MKYSALSNRIIGKIKKEPAERVSTGGIILAVNAPELDTYDEIEVLSVGRGYVAQSGSIVPMESKVGDVVYLVKKTAITIPSKDIEGIDPDKETLVVFQESEIMFKKVN